MKETAEYKDVDANTRGDRLRSFINCEIFNADAEISLCISNYSHYDI